MYKHYIRLDNNYIIKGFNCVHLLPLETDILIYEGDERHFHLNGILPLGLSKDNRCPNYKYINNEILILSSEDILLWETENLPTPIDPNLSIDERIDMNMLEIAILKGEVIP